MGWIAPRRWLISRLIFTRSKRNLVLDNSRDYPVHDSFPQDLPMLELTGVSKSYQGVMALRPTDLAVPDGKTTVLIGPSGSGKSTLLRLMIGLIAPDTGRVRFQGMELTAQNVLGLRRRMGYVVQDGGLFPHLTARGNITLMAGYLGWDEKRTSERVAGLAALTQFPADGLERYPVQLSGGQQQRVSLMRALLLDPDVL